MKENEMLEKILKLGKVIMFILIGILVVLIIGVSKMYSSTNVENKSKSEASEYNTEYDVSMFKEIKASDIKSETKNNLSVVYIGRESCGWCAAFLPNLWDGQKDYGFTTLYIDISKIIDFSANVVSDENSYNILTSLTGEGYDGYMKENFGATPMILVMKDNKIIKAQTGYSEYETFETLLKEAGIEKK